MQNQDGDFWGEPIFSFSRAQAIADGVLVDVTDTKDDNGQFLCLQAGFKITVAITRGAWAKTVEAGGIWKSEGQGEVLELKGGQSVTGRLWDLLWMLRLACGQAGDDDRVRFEVLVDVHGDGHHELVNLWALCGPGDEGEPVMTVMLEGED